LKYVITGRPGVGKSTLFNTIVDTLKKHGFTVGGIIAPEVREGTLRTGFMIVDIATGEKTWLARRDYPSTVKVGAYGVLVDEADRIVVKALEKAIQEASVIAVDEVGPMELKLPSFKPYLLKALDSNKPVILVVHYRLNDEEILSRLRDAERIVVTIENREKLRREIPLKIIRALAGSESRSA